NRRVGPLLFTIGLSLIGRLSYAGPIRDLVMERRLAQRTSEIEQSEGFGRRVSLPAGVRVVRDVPYGKDERQRMDVYLPKNAAGSPVILMVHGGAWRLGDKGTEPVVENKVTRWVSKGFIFISINYRMLPDAAPMEQAQDVARALAVAQGKAATWGGD